METKLAKPQGFHMWTELLLWDSLLSFLLSTCHGAYEDIWEFLFLISGLLLCLELFKSGTFWGHMCMGYRQSNQSSLQQFRLEHWAEEPLLWLHAQLEQAEVVTANSRSSPAFHLSIVPGAVLPLPFACGWRSELEPTFTWVGLVLACIGSWSVSL